MSREMQSLLSAIAFALTSVCVFGLHWLFTGISKDFGVGIFVGFFLGMGLIGILSKQAREL